MATIRQVRPDLMATPKTTDNQTYAPIPPYPPDGHLTGRDRDVERYRRRREGEMEGLEGEEGATINRY